MGTNFNPDIILEVAERLKEYKNIEFQMIGQGVRKRYFEENAEKRGLKTLCSILYNRKTWYRMCTVLVLFVLFH